MIVAATPEPPGPHELRPPRLDGLGRVGEQIASAETAALSDAIRHLHHRFQGLYLIRPSHNPIRPLDLTGAYDERSDRVQPLEELMERGYEDAYRQFIEPFLGASGERMLASGPQTQCSHRLDADYFDSLRYRTFGAPDRANAMSGKPSRLTSPSAKP